MPNLINVICRPIEKSDSSAGALDLDSGNGFFIQDRRVLLKVRQRSENSFPNGKSRFPTQAAYAGAIQEDEWAIADPSSWSAAVNPIRMDAERFTNPSQRVIDGAMLVCAQVEN